MKALLVILLQDETHLNMFLLRSLHSSQKPHMKISLITYNIELLLPY